jgi:peptide deformylase
MEILTIRTKEHEKILRKKTEEFAFANFSKKEIKELIAKMRQVMKAANGIGLAANQIGLPYRMFVAEIPDRNGKLKFYALFNPKLEFVSEKKLLLDEGCLSVPGVFGTLERS